MLNDFLSIIFPRLCVCCSSTLHKNESLIFVNCRAELPRTGFHTQENNLVQKKFWGRVDVKMATAFLYFDKAGKVQRILHQLKYKGLPEIGEMMGHLFAVELSSLGAECNFDAIVPVPLHPAKQLKRGYNQSYHFALGLSQGLDIPVFDGLLSRNIYTESQTKKGRFDRWKNVSKVFDVNREINIKDKDLLLVDDVITTGATIEACVQKLVENGALVSVASIACAH